MSTKIMALVWPLQMPPTAKSVLISLADNANDHGYCWPSIDTIAERTCYGRSTVMRAIKQLEDAGFLVADRSNGRHTRYQLNVNNQCQSDTRITATPVSERHQTSVRVTPNQCQSDTLTVKNRKEPVVTNVTTKADAKTKLPDYLPMEIWKQFREHRISLKARMTPLAESKNLKTLDRLVREGNDPVAVIEQSIEQGWKGLFEIKPSRGNANEHHSSKPKLSAAERAEQRGRELLNRIGQSEGADLLLGSNGGDVW